MKKVEHLSEEEKNEIESQIQKCIDEEDTFEKFFANAALNPNAHLTRIMH